jgi:hypothetical protein
MKLSMKGLSELQRQEAHSLVLESRNISSCLILELVAVHLNSTSPWVAACRLLPIRGTTAIDSKQSLYLKALLF